MVKPPLTPTLQAGELTTTNYGWVKPTVGASVDAWGGYINTDLDGIDSTVHGIQTSVPAASSTTPAMDGTAAVGTAATFARADHVHPVDMSRYAATNPSGYQTAAQVTTSLGPYALIASPTFTGVPAAPTPAPGTNTTQLATTAFVSALPAAMGDNRIINGDMRIDQRNNGASGTASAYTADRWTFNSGGVAGKGTWQRQSGVSCPGFPYCLGFTSSSAYTPAATEAFQLAQTLEADAVSDFGWGTANAQPVTLSFWAYSSLTGAFSGAIGDYAFTRAYPFSYLLPTANTWTKIVVTIPGDTGGAWVMNGNAGSVAVDFDLGTGATYRGAAGAWAATGYIGVTGAVRVISTNGAIFYVTGVKLEIGSVATPFNRQSLAKSMADCQRYYQIGSTQLNLYSLAGGASVNLPLTTPMRAAPTIVPNFTTQFNCSGSVVNSISASTWQHFLTVTASGVFNSAGTFTASAEL